jgi:putative two-component system response regulator
MALRHANTHIVVAADGLSACGRAIERILRREGYEAVSFAGSGAEAIALCSHRSVDLLMLDLRLPDLDGLVVIEQLAPVMRKGRLQVIVVSDRDDMRLRYRALALGVRDFITEPIDPDEVRLRARNALIASTLEGQLIAKNSQLEELIETRSNELAHARQEVLRHLAIAAEFRDDDTGEHTDRVGRTAALIGEAYGLDPEAVRMLGAAAPLHDVGKIGLPDRIVLKHGRLTAREREVMQTHAQIGAAILAGGDVAELRLAETIALHHHERWDGSGYPFGLAGDSIPLAARIVAIADVFDALAFERQYKPAWPLADAVAEIDAQRGRQFDPLLVDAFMLLDHHELIAPIHPERSAARRRDLSAVGARCSAGAGRHASGVSLSVGAGR